MSHNILLVATAGALLMTAPVLAAAATTHPAHAAAKTTAMTTAKSTKTVPTKTASATTEVHHHAKMARRAHRKVARNMSGDREVHALNALESAGYRHFSNLHASGTDFVATATKAGKSYDVTVMPTGQIEANRA